MRRSFALLLAAGCGSQSMPPVDNTPHIDVTSQTYTLQPGEEKYYCYAMNLPADKKIVVTKLVPTYGVGTHHILFSQTLAPEPDGFSECNVLAKTTWLPMYAGGKNSGPLTAPEGAAFYVQAPGQQVVMQLHLQNASGSPISDTTTMRIEYADPSAQQFTPAGLFGYDDHVLTIPPHTQAAVNTMSCTMDKDLDVFAMLGHMHKHGKHLTLSRGANAGDEVLFDTDWSFDVQPVTPFVATVHKGDVIHLTCTHENETDVAIPYGESSDQEMCATVLYYTPYQGLDGCMKTM